MAHARAANATTAPAVNAHGSFVWYELMTPDPVDAKRFYDAVIGWSIDAQASDGYRMIGRADGGHAGGVLTLTEDMRSHGAEPCWLGYVGVTDVDAAVKALQADGGSLLMPARDIPDAGRIAMVADPDGAAFYVMKPTPPADRPDAVSDVFSIERPQTCRWNELAAVDPQRAIDFYTRHFGWRQEGELDMGEMGAYRFLYHGATMIGAVWPKPPQMPRPAWSFYFGVEDIDRAASTVKHQGGHVLMEPMQIPGGEYSLNAFDPQGAAFGLVGPRR